jgi:hypothetical protein
MQKAFGYRKFMRVSNHGTVGDPISVNDNGERCVKTILQTELHGISFHMITPVRVRIVGEKMD